MSSMAHHWFMVYYMLCTTQMALVFKNSLLDLADIVSQAHTHQDNLQIAQIQ